MFEVIVSQRVGALNGIADILKKQTKTIEIKMSN